MGYTYVKQHDSKDCGVACLATVCAHYGLKLPLIKYKEMTKSDNMGTNMLGLVEAGKQLGFKTDALNGSFEDLTREIVQDKIPLPCVAHVIINNTFEHFVVIHKIKGEHIILADPASGIVKKTIDEFLMEWTGNIISYKKTEKFVSGKRKINLFSFFIKNIPAKRKMVTLILGFSVASSLIGIVTSMLYSMVIDGVILGNYSTIPVDWASRLRAIQATDILLIIASAGIVLEIMKVSFDILRGRLVARLSVIFDDAIIGKYYEHLLNLPIGFFSTKKTGELISRFNDAIKIRTALISLLLSVTLDVVMVLGGGFLLFRLSSNLFLLSLVLIGAFLVIIYLFKSRIEQLEKKIMHANGLVTSFLKETISGIETVKTFQLEHSIFGSFRKIWDKSQEFDYKGSVTDNTRFSLVSFISSTGTLCLYLFGAKEILSGQLSIGVLISYSTLMTYFLSPFTNIVNLQTEVQAASVALDRLGDILFSEVEQQGEGKQLSSLAEEIRFDRVSFRYGNRQPVLKNVSFTISKNQLVSIVGESGSGKTTIAKLLLQFFKKENGRIFIGDSEIEEIDLSCLREKIALVSQSSFFFNESIINNLRKGNSELTDEEIVMVCQKCGIHPFIMLPMQYDSILEEGGNNLSGGQRQLLSIVRALLKRPNVLILDEATSNLDSYSEELIGKVLEELEITCIIIAHRLKTVVNSDQIIVLKNGEIDHIGTHQQLLQKSSLYTEMIEKQRII
ncbi:peptidase domain-containing ABC transporter [Enterococcus sp. UD-01]|jgi:ABC-type bacteriocin transporter|uniref:peptidase domain-containing ABC transporter n=1 Tax=Enterococcus sp. UD-01 TaxID=3373911 RepID=UPI00383638D9